MSVEILDLAALALTAVFFALLYYLHKKKHVDFGVRTILAVGLGLIVGLVFKGHHTYVAAVGTIYAHVVSAVVIPLLIFSIISSGDAVARVLPAAWGYHRNGCDRFLPATRNAEELADLDALGAEFGPTPLVISSLATAEDTSALINIVARFCVSRENFHQKYEAAIMDMIQCAFLRSEKEVVDGYILSDGEIVERLQSLSHMKEIDYWQIVGSVWAASTMSRPILERYGQNVPLLARQILIPVLAVGLCYGIETDVVQMVAQYIIRLLTARGELDSVLRAAFCHHPENYISLMEYYTPEEHGMEPFTRK